jgi:hypothetical protein
MMARTYSSAQAVLVLDRDIQNCSGDSPIERISLLVYSSGWMGRLWTYQEAALARKLVFVMEDGLFHFNPDNLGRNTLPLGLIWSQLMVQLKSRFHNSDGFLIGYVSRALRWRSTSKPDDESLAVAGMLKIDTSVLLRYRGEERFAQFWRLLNPFPKEVQ